MPTEDFDQHLKSMAQELGIVEVQRIHVLEVPVEEWIRLKCQYGCPNYGRRLTCPPYSPDAEKMRTILDSYNTAFLLRYDAPGRSEENEVQVSRDGTELAFDAFLRLERFTFVNGYPKAFVFGLNHCPGCEGCVLEEGILRCYHAQMARPSLEACSINLRKLVENVGWQGQLKGVNVFKGDDMVSLISLLLLE